MKLFTKRGGVTINVSTEAIVRAIVLVLITLLVVRFIGRIGHELELFLIAGFMALALNPAVTWLTRHLHIKSRVRATGLAYIIVLVILASFIALVVPPLVKQTDTFITSLPSTINSLNDKNSAPGRFVQHHHLEKQVDTLSNEVKSKFGDVPGAVVTTASKVGAVVISVITIIVLTFMMLVEGPLWLDRVWASTPHEKRRTYQELLRKMYHVITGYVNGQVLIAAIAAVFASVTLLIASNILHVSINAIALAGIVFMFGLIPLIGNTLAAILVVILCLFTSVPLAIVMAIYFPIYQQTENSTLQPHIQAKSNQLTPLLVFMAALIGAGFGGLLGAFVAIPAAGCLRILMEHRYGEKVVFTKEDVEEAKE